MVESFATTFLFTIAVIPALMIIGLLRITLEQKVLVEVKPQESGLGAHTKGLSILDVVSSGKRFRPASSENEVWMSVCVSSGLIVQDGTNYPYAMSVPLLTCSYELDMTEKVLEK
jgi:hypothetical protein